MRKMKKPPAEELRKKKEEPLAEGLQFIVPTDSRGRRMWSRMRDEEITEYARKVMEEREISGRKELRDTDKGLYEALRKRRLLGEIEFDNKQRHWKGMGDEEIVEFARRAMREEKIGRREELKKADPGLYNILRKRGLLGEIEFVDKPRSWMDLSNKEVLEVAKKLMDDKGISRRTEFQKADHGLYKILRKRELHDKVGFVEKKRSWRNMTDQEILNYAKKVMESEGINKRGELSKADSGLHKALRKRGLLDEVGFLDKQRSWKGMSNDQVVDYARKVIEENRINSRSKLRNIDPGLCSILHIRGLLNRAFAHIEKQRTDSARNSVIDALEAFAANDNNSAENDVA